MDLIKESLDNPLWNKTNIIYCYTNKINGKKYIGQVNGRTKTLRKRHKRHLLDNLIIDQALRKYGEENFTLEILHFGESLEELNYFEDFYILYYNSLISNGNGYNVARGGSNGNPFEGKTEEEMNEFKKKQSQAHKGEKNYWYGKQKPHNEETKIKIGQANKGKKRSDESRKNLSDAKKGRKLSEETKNKISEKKKGINAYQCKKVAQYDEKGNLIKIWNYIKQVEEELNISSTNVNNCCIFWEMNYDKDKWFETHKKNPCKKAGGFIWKYYKED